uniref:Uncharacterized protein n=1 Tax=Ditylenchus dipsaci TaxID=166011 RepID=A0A915ELX5_9BILA
MPNPTKAAAFGGSIALLVKQGILFSTEWGDIKRMAEGFQSDFDKTEDNLYGFCINVWDLQRKRLLQTMCLDKIEGRMAVCIRMLHHTELIHGYVSSAIGGCVYHLHKNSKTGFFSADRVLKFPTASVDGWLDSEVTAFPCDMVISMDDDYLFVACWLQGFITTYEITDPFKPSLTQRIFMGGVIHSSLGVDLLNIACADFTPMHRTVGGRVWEGGPAKLQLSLDGRRLFVTNSFFRPWDEQIYPNLIKSGSSIALIHIDSKSGEMKLDEQFGIFFDNDTTNEEDEQFLAREMKFLNGDSTSDTL